MARVMVRIRVRHRVRVPFRSITVCSRTTKRREYPYVAFPVPVIGLL